MNEDVELKRDWDVSIVSKVDRAHPENVFDYILGLKPMARITILLATYTRTTSTCRPSRLRKSTIGSIRLQELNRDLQHVGIDPYDHSLCDGL